MKESIQGSKVSFGPFPCIISFSFSLFPELCGLSSATDMEPERRSAGFIGDACVVNTLNTTGCYQIRRPTLGVGGLIARRTCSPLSQENAQPITLDVERYDNGQGSRRLQGGINPCMHSQSFHL
jgi:hypothetical protein